MFIRYEAEVSSRVGGGERGVVDFGKLFTETNEQKFTLDFSVLYWASITQVCNKNCSLLQNCVFFKQ